MSALTRNEKVALDFLNELKQCTQEQLDRYELMFMAESAGKSDNLKEFLRVAFERARDCQPLAICMKGGTA